MKKLILAAPALAALTACGTTAQLARTAALTGSAPPLSCQAYMSKTRPADGTTTVVHVRTQASVKVFTVTFYKTVDRAYFARAGLDGRARVSYYISEATPGRDVPVVVTVVRRHSARTCSTSFTPQPPGSPSPSPSPSPTSATPSPPPGSPAPSRPPAACHPRDSEGHCYRAGEHCPDADHGMHGVAADGEAIICADDNGWRWEPA